MKREILNILRNVANFKREIKLLKKIRLIFYRTIHKFICRFHRIVNELNLYMNFFKFQL